MEQLGSSVGAEPSARAVTAHPATQAVRDAERALDAATEARDQAIREYLTRDGVTHDQAAQEFGVSRQRVGQLARRMGVARGALSA